VTKSDAACLYVETLQNQRRDNHELGRETVINTFCFRCRNSTSQQLLFQDVACAHLVHIGTMTLGRHHAVAGASNRSPNNVIYRR
jgi:hypothetical protein